MKQNSQFQMKGAEPPMVRQAHHERVLARPTHHERRLKCPTGFVQMQYQQGFTIVMAMFILVVLGLLGGYMVRLSGTQAATSTYTVQSARAYQAAKAGLGWAVARIKGGGVCADVNSQTAFTLPGLPGFTVQLSCSVSAYSEGDQSPQIYKLNARSQYATYTSGDYVVRSLEVSIVK